MKIAIIGAGISGLGSSLILKDQHDVHLFESNQRWGGHAHTSDVVTHKGDSVALDTGFLVYNELTYPHLTALFKYLNVETVDSDMSLSIRSQRDHIEWAGDNISTVFAQKRNLLRPSFYKMLFQILKFHRKAPVYRTECQNESMNLEDFLDRHGYGQEIRQWYILPMVAAIWSTGEKDMLKFPAETFFNFFLNHKLLQVNDRPIWRTVKNGSRNYVQKIISRLQKTSLGEAVVSVQNSATGIQVQTVRDTYHFDKVIFATSAPIALGLIQNPTQQQKNILGSFKTTPNQAYLHSDISWMPKNNNCWASWNVLAQGLDQRQQVSLTYYLNRLQPLQTKDQLLLTLNCDSKPEGLLMQTSYEHPEMNRSAIEAQKKLDEIQGLENMYFCGAWTRYGFHEDGLLSAVQVAKKLGAEPPWSNLIQSK